MRLLLFLCVFVHSVIFADDGLQILRGRVVNGINQLPVAEAEINIIGLTNYTTLTDSLGNYNLQVIPGKYSLIVRRKGFKILQRENVLVIAGKQQVEEFELSELKVVLDTVSVKTLPADNEVPIDLLSAQQTAGVFYDPARVVNSHAGVINADDQANHISVHGTSPNYLQWKMEGVEVVNPNHLENAGTINDRPTLNGGGVCLLSAQLIQNSGFYFAPFDASSGNALSGLFDMKLRNGNNQKSERIIQVGLLGTDISLEGPFSKNHKASYLFNLRYSTVGLLSQIGVNFGDEKINYKDFSYIVTLPHRLGIVKVFGVAGDSENNFKGKTDSTLVEVEKDLQNIDYRSATSINGISSVLSLSGKAYLKTVIAYSTKDISRTASPSSPIWPYQISEKDNYSQQKLSTLNYFVFRVSKGWNLKAGAYFNYFSTTLFSSANEIPYLNGSVIDPVLQPFVGTEATMFKKLNIEAGIHSLYQVRTGDFILQPRVKLRFMISARQEIAFNYGMGAQLQPGELALNTYDNTSLKPTQVNTFSLIHQIQIRQLLLKTEMFFQDYYNVPVSDNGFSAFNYFNGPVLSPLNTNGNARTFGADISAKLNFLNAFYVIMSGSIYKSEYTINPSEYYTGRFCTNYNAVLTAGKEFKFNNEKKLYGVNFRALMREGFREISEGNALPFVYDRQLSPYFRFDLRLSYRKNRQNSSFIWALDIQNLSNQQNSAYHYYDDFTKKEETKYQLGLIPVLSFKIMF